MEGYRKVQDFYQEIVCEAMDKAILVEEETESIGTYRGQ